METVYTARTKHNLCCQGRKYAILRNQHFRTIDLETEEGQLMLTKEINKHIKHEAEAARAELLRLLEQVDPEDLLVSSSVLMLLVPEDEISDYTVGTIQQKTEILAYELFINTSFGRSDNPRPISSSDIEICHNSLSKLLTARSWETLGKISDSKIDRILEVTSSHARTVRGNAFPTQTRDRILQVQGRFDNWFKSRIGISPTAVIQLLQSILDIQNRNINEVILPAARDLGVEYAENVWKSIRAKKKKSRTQREQKLIRQISSFKKAKMFGANIALPEIVAAKFPVSGEDLNPQPTEQEWEALLSLFSFDCSCPLPIGMDEVRHLPLLKLSDNRVFLVDWSNALDSVWEKFDAVARSDQSFYNRRYQRSVSSWVEERVCLHLQRIFGVTNVYKNLSYRDSSDTGNDTLYELDGLVKWGPFILLIEAKARQFRIQGLLGDPGRLRTDLASNVKDAFSQALRAEHYIKNANSPVFTESESGREVPIENDKLKRVYLLTVTMHDMSMLTTQLNSLVPFGLFATNEYPFAISEPDLEIIANLCEGPDVLLHYIEQRLKIHSIKEPIRGDELDLYSLYLDTRFLHHQLWGNPSRQFQAYMISGYSDPIDRWMRAKWLGMGTIPDISLKIPEVVKKIIELLREDQSDSAKWFLFSILDLTNDALNAIDYAFSSLNPVGMEAGGYRRFVTNLDGVVLCVVYSQGNTLANLKKNLFNRVELEKYRHRCSKGIGFGIMAESGRLFSTTELVTYEWEYNSAIESRIATDVDASPVTVNKKLGRNDPCFCGSGRKYKLCHLRRLSD